MASSDFSLTRIVHDPRVHTKTPAPATPPTAAASSAATATTAPSFTAVFAAISAAATAAGTTVATTAPPTAGSTTPAAAAAAAPVAAPADTTDDPAGPLFGANPWLTDPTGSGPGPVTNYNPIYFATPQTAQTVAQMVGGTVVSEQVFTPSPGSPFQQNEPNLMVQLPNGGLVNPGLVADIYTHGWNQTFVNQQVANEVAGAEPAATNT